MRVAPRWVDPTEHRPKLDASMVPGACVCRRVDRKEVKANQVTEKATQQERDRLRSRKAWDESNPREWDAVAREARDTKEEVHAGIVFGFVVEKTQIFWRATPPQVRRKSCFPGE